MCGTVCVVCMCVCVCLQNLGGEAAEAQEYLMKLPDRIRKLAERAQGEAPRPHPTLYPSPSPYPDTDCVGNQQANDVRMCHLMFVQRARRRA